MSRQNLFQIFKNVLSNIQKTKEIAQKQIIDDLIDRLMKQTAKYPKDFAKYLDREYDVKPQTIRILAQGLFLRIDTQEINNRLIHLWLLFKIYDVMDITRGKQNKEKRQRIERAFIQFNFTGSKIENLLQVCHSAIGETINQNDLNDLSQMIRQGRTKQLQSIFVQEQNFIAYDPDKSVQEHLKDLIIDYKFFPQQSLEKEIQRQIILAHVHLHIQGKRIIDKQLPKDKHISDIVALETKYLEEFGSMPSEINELFTKISSPQQAYTSLCALKAKVLTINVPELERLINKTRQAELLVKNKDVLLMIGNTGSGKSTNILKFLGYNLKKGKFKKLDTLIPIQQLIPEHRTFYTSPQMKSCTRYINAAPIPDKMYKTGYPEHKKILVICDSPGFGDSAGIEVDIANGVGMINALYGAKSARVVVILPKDSITADRMAGAVKISEIISNLFFQLTVLQSIDFYFSRVQKSMITQMPQLIKDKINNLSQVEKSNKRLIAILKEIQESSKDQQKYIYPLQTNYKVLFNKLIKKDPICDTRESFQYQFTIQTKQKIDNFIQKQRSKVKDYFSAGKMKLAHFHMYMLEKMMNIIHNNQQIRIFYQDLAKFIQHQSQKELKHYQQLIMSIIKCKQSQNTKQKLKESRQKIIQIEKTFGKLQRLALPTSHNIDQITQNIRKQLLQKFDKLTELDTETIMATKAFSTYLDKELGKTVLSLIVRRFNEVEIKVNQQILKKEYYQMEENLKILVNLAEFYTKLTHESAINDLEARLYAIKATINQVVEACMSALNWISKADSSLNDKIVMDAEQKIQQVNVMQSLKFLDKKADIKSKLSVQLRNIQKRCRKIIIELSSLNLSLSEDDNDNVYIVTGIQKGQLKDKKRQIELLMKFNHVSQALKDEFDETLGSIYQKQKENIEVLNKYIEALRNNKGEQVYNNINAIKKAVLTVLQCSKIVGDSHGSEQLTQQIQTKFVKHFEKQKNLKLKSLDFKLNQIGSEVIIKLTQYYNKFYSYQKMSCIGDKIKKANQQLIEQLLKILQAPLLEFMRTDIPYLVENKHYKFISNSIGKFEKFCNYLLTIKQDISFQDFKIVSKYQQDIINNLKPFYDQITLHTEQFQKSQHNHRSRPQFIKDLIKTLLSISQKKMVCRYLNRTLDFEATDKLNITQIKLHQLKTDLFNSFTAAHNNTEQLEVLIQSCKFFAEIEDIYKSKGEPANKFGFKEVQKDIQETFNSNNKNDQLFIKQIISNNKPTKINFSDVQFYYKKSLTISASEGKRLRRCITHELKTVERQTWRILSGFRKEMNDPNFISNQGRIDDFLEALTEAVQIQKQLKKIYTQEQDKSLIEILPEDIHRIGVKIINVFQSEYQIVTGLLKNLDLQNIKEKLKTFDLLQNMIYEVFNLQNQQVSSKKIDKQQPSADPTAKKLAEFVSNNAQNLRKTIQDHAYLKQQDKINAKMMKRLRNLLQIYRKGAQQEVKTKYQNYSPTTFQIDEKFSTYYFNVKEDVQRLLKFNVQQYMSTMNKQYIENYNCSTDAAKKIKEKIQQKISLLPNQLKIQYKILFESIKSKLVQDNDELIKTVTNQFDLKNPMNASNLRNFSTFFRHAQMAKINKKTEFHKKWVQKLGEIYEQQEQRGTSLEERIAFIQVFFIQLYQKNNDKIRQDQLMHQLIVKHYKSWLSKIIKQQEKHINTLINSMSVTNGGDQQKKIQIAKQLVKKIFKIYNFIVKINDNFIINFKQYRKKIVTEFQTKLNSVVEYYCETLKCKPEEKLSSNDILDPIVMKRLQNYIEDISYAGAVIEAIQEQIKNMNIVKKPQQSSINSRFNLTSLNNIEQYLPILKSYENQIAQMLNYIKQYEFWNDIKRNLSPKEIEEDICQLNRYYEILNLRRDLFLKFIIKSAQNEYDFTEIDKILKSKLQQYVHEAQQQINSIFEKIYGEPPVIINLLIQQLSILRSKEKQFKFVNPKRIKEISDKISRQIREMFEKVRNDCSKHFQDFKNIFNKVSNQIKKLQSKKTDQSNYVRTMYKTDIREKIEELSIKYEQEIDAERSQSRRQILMKKLSTQSQSIKNDLNQAMQIEIRQIQNEINRQINKESNDLRIPTSQFINSLIIFHKGITDLFIFQDIQKYKKHMQSILQNVQKLGPKCVKVVQEGLLQTPNDYRSIGKLILNSSKTFANFAVTMINKLIKGQDIAYVLRQIAQIKLDKRAKMKQNQLDLLKSNYERFDLEYEEYKKSYKKNPNITTINYMIGTIKEVGNTIKQDFYQTRNKQRSIQLKIKVLAGIFALWAIIKAENYQSTVEFTIQPHPTQITTLILLLGMSRQDESIANMLAQVGTGEGKSIVLAGLSCYLALVGFKVRCACFSAYLSGRDQQSFKQLFQMLGVENRIQYGTFNSICEDILNNNGNNFKDQMERMLLQPANDFTKQLEKLKELNNLVLKDAKELLKNPTILIIDEVDVFFDDSFFGNSYCPAITLRGQEVKSFMEYVWRTVQKYNIETDQKKLIQSKQFGQLIKTYPSLYKMLQNQVHGMIAGALNYKHDYYIIDKRIAYKDSDSISFKINYGYKTVFAYLHQYQQSRVSKVYCEQAMQISLMVAEFSYAALPSYFCNILGVTGTLEVLPKVKKNLLSINYHIKEQYAIPSAFGINKKRLQEYTLAKRQNFYAKIVEKINNIKDMRPVIVFFKSAIQLNDFFNSPQYQPLIKRTSNLTEQHDQSTRDSRIQNAVSPGKITFMTRAFGRGTDIVILDDAIKQKGGLHVIQTYLSLQESQQVQIKGRTARQNAKGSYDCIINEDCLEELDIDVSKVSKDISSDSFELLLQNARQKKTEKEALVTNQRLLLANKKHQKVVELLKTTNITQNLLKNYVSQLNQYPVKMKKTIKTVLGLDATGSMNEALKKTCQIIGSTFQRTYKVISKKNADASIDIKIVVYRNYSSLSQQILEATAFQNTSLNLKRFLDRVSPKGGQGNEALQVLFQYLNKEQKVDQVILIGDAASNSYEETNQRRKKMGQEYWVSKGYPKTNFNRQFTLFKGKNCPVHCFYLKAEDFFSEISMQTNGNCSPFKLNHSSVSDELTNFLVINILKLIEASSEKSDLNLVQTYRKMYVK